MKKTKSLFGIMGTKKTTSKLDQMNEAKEGQLDSLFEEFKIAEETELETVTGGIPPTNPFNKMQNKEKE